MEAAAQEIGVNVFRERTHGEGDDTSTSLASSNEKRIKQACAAELLLSKKKM